MGTLTIDPRNTAEIITAGQRVLVDGLGADAAKTFLNNYVNEQNNRPRITDEEMEVIMAEARKEIESLRPYGTGDYTAEKYELAEPSNEDLIASFQRREAEMDAIRREHPEYTLREQLHELGKRETARLEK